MLPRLRWVPVIGPFLARVLPPKVHRGIVLSYDEFRPFREEWEESWAKATTGELKEEEFQVSVARFLKAQRLPVRAIFSLPGTVLTEVLEELFLCQTRSNLPREMTEIMEKEIAKRRTGQASRGRARGTRPKAMASPTQS